MDLKKRGEEPDDELDLQQECAEVPEEPVKGETAASQKAEFISPWKIVAATAVCMLLLMVLAVVVINSITGRNWPFDLIPEKTTAPTEVPAVTEHVYTPDELGMVEGIDTKAAYMADADALDSSAVIATVGDIELTNGQLQIIFWNQFYRFVSQYDYSSTNLDITANLSDQPFPQSTVTWEQYFLSAAFQTWHQYAALNIAAAEEGYELPAKTLEDLANLAQEYGNQAVENGYDSAEALLEAQFGPGITLDDLVAVETLYAIGDGYYTQYRASLNPTREEVEAYFDENAALFESYYGVTKDLGKLVNVRHVLLQPEGCEFDDNYYVVATDEQWEACRAEAQALLDSWVEGGASEDAFSELAMNYSVDGSASSGGLYENVYSGQMVEAFDAWIFDESRAAGDYGLVKTEFGYHLMYYVSGEEAWYMYGLNSSDGIIYTTCYQMIDSHTTANPLQVTFDKVVFGSANLSGGTTVDPIDPLEATEATE